MRSTNGKPHEGKLPMENTDTQSSPVNWNALGVDQPPTCEESFSKVQNQTNGQESSGKWKTPQVIGFTGVKGGVGTTTVALNLAMALTQSGHRVILGELSAHPGTAAPYLNLTWDPSMDPASLNPADINPASLGRMVMTHSTGLQVLFMSLWTHPGGTQISTGLLESVLEELKNRADCVLVDFPLEPSLPIKFLLHHCHLLNVISDIDPVSLENAQQRMKFLSEECHAPTFVTGVNRTSMPPADGIKGIQDRLGCETIGIIPPATELCYSAINKKLPIVCNNPQSGPAIQFFQIRDHLLGRLTGNSSSFDRDRRHKDRRKQDRRASRDGW